jgi:diadenosine tetraphosphate (Ap4A) HIT family hydrolase
MANATQLKFGYPEGLIAEYAHWCVLLRPAQATLGALVLVCKDEANAFSDISGAAFSELQRAVSDIETALKAFRPYDKINYLMLMMVDPDVHFHVLPRYAGTQSFASGSYPDPGWPGPPDISQAVTPPAEDFAALIAAIKAVWPADQGAVS